jgi:hypothetical protein
MNETQQKFPIGPFTPPKTITDQQLEEAIMMLEVFPEQLKHIVYGLNNRFLDSPYRTGSWTIRQLIHHIADSHHHAYNRLRWALSEDNPVIKAYDQDAFAAMDDYKKAPIAWSISHIEALHQKLVYLLNSLNEEQWERSFVHPETGQQTDIRTLALLYAWHSMHHYAHLKNGIARIKREAN